MLKNNRSKKLRILLLIVVICVAVLCGMEGAVLSKGDSLIVEPDAAPKSDCILVLGAAVYSDYTPTPVLQDRLDTGIELYKAGVAPKLLLSGDNGQVNYNEVEAMKNYALEHGVKEKDIFLDHAGFSTYESMYRARDVFNVRSAIVVTQKYHEYRALYIGESMGMKVHGVVAPDNHNSIGPYARTREVLARIKDFAKCITKPEPTYLGEVIDIKGDGQKSW